LRHSIVGPGVSIGSGALIENSRVSESIIQSNAVVKDMRLHKAMIGKSAEVAGVAKDLSVGDFSKLKL
jgi:glucose-1-phosphate thymidylyltransferase